MVPTYSTWDMGCCRKRHPRTSRCSPACWPNRQPEMAQVAVVLMNLGGPDSLDAVRPFLVNLFNDPAIIGVPSALRWPLAGLIEALVRLIRPALDAATSTGRRPRLLLTAHGLPMKIVRAGDPYPTQVEETAAAVVDGLAWPGLDWRVCYQSRVGPLRWLEPA